MRMTAEAKELLENTVERMAKLEEEQKALKQDVKDIRKRAANQLGEYGVTEATLTQLAKEHLWDEVDRIAERAHQETLDQCRHALGTLADTPLGEHAQERQIKKTIKRASRRMAEATAP